MKVEAVPGTGRHGKSTSFVVGLALGDDSAGGTARLIKSGGEALIKERSVHCRGDGAAVEWGMGWVLRAGGRRARASRRDNSG